MRVISKKIQKKLLIRIVILQNGVFLSDRNLSNSRNFSIRLTSKKENKYNISIPCYQFYDNERSIIECKNGVFYLRGFLGCHGVGSTKGEFVQLKEHLRDETFLELEHDDYASFGYKDLRILVKVSTFSKKTRIKQERRKKEYYLSLREIFFSSRYEKICFFSSFFVSLFIFVGITAGLFLNGYQRPKDIRDIPDHYVLPFVSEKYIQALPEILKEKLNVHDLLENILEYNNAVVNTLTNTGVVSPLIPLETRDSYLRMFKDRDERVAQSVDMQRSVDYFKRKTPDTYLVVIPAVKSETLDGTISRVLDKVDLIIKGSQESLSLRKSIVHEFKSDTPHIYEEYHNINPTEKNDALKQIKPWALLTTEEQLYDKVGSLARMISQSKSPVRKLRDSYFPIAFEPGSDFATFILDSLPELDEPLDLKISGSPLRLRSPTQSIEKRQQAEFDAKKIESLIEMNKYQLQICYEIALKTDESSEGSMEWKWKVDQNGRIFDVILVAANLNNEKMIRCIREKITQWKFPPIKNGVIEISFPFEFSPTKG